MKKRLLAIILPIVLALAIGGAVLAASTANLSSSGSLIVADESGASFTCGTTLTWDGGTVVKNNSITLHSSLDVTASGNVTITKFGVTPTSISLAGTTFTLAVNDLSAPLTFGQNATLHFTLTGTPITAGSYNLHDEIDTITLTANPTP
jgi:hypothetical protein